MGQRQVFADDGRNFLLVRSKRYDVISIDPAPPIWSAGDSEPLHQRVFRAVQNTPE
jgi:hypothetical protein